MFDYLYCILYNFTLLYRGDSYFADAKSPCVRFDSGFREYEQEQEPHLEKAIHAVKFVAQHVKNLDRYDKVKDQSYFIFPDRFCS